MQMDCQLTQKNNLSALCAKGQEKNKSRAQNWKQNNTRSKSLKILKNLN